MSPEKTGLVENLRSSLLLGFLAPLELNHPYPGINRSAVLADIRPFLDGMRRAEICALKHLEKVEDRLEIPKFPLHKPRHYYASQMSAMGVPDADILKMGGWEMDHVMKSVYRHSMTEKEEQTKSKAAEKLQNALFS